MNEFVLEVRKLDVEIQGKPILQGIDFALHKGDILGLFGDSGSGKTTVLHSIMGLLLPRFRTKGEIIFAGRNIERIEPDKRSWLGMSIVLQDIGLFEDRTVFENVAYPLRRRNIKEDVITAEVADTLKFLHIQQLAKRSPAELSGGQRQRAALARALVYRPALLLLDEPLRGLEAELRLQFLAFVRSVSATGTTIIFVSHDRDELKLVATKVLTLGNGRIVDSEVARPGAPLHSLENTAFIPGSGSGEYFKVCDLRIVEDGKSAPDNSVEVLVVEWRPMGSGRYGALVKYTNGEPGWLLLDIPTTDFASLPTGTVRIGYQKIGDSYAR